MEKIDVIGCGYVGYSISLLLSKHNEVNVYDIDENKILVQEENLLITKDSYKLLSTRTPENLPVIN